jgi:hypothetical protein
MQEELKITTYLVFHRIGAALLVLAIILTRNEETAWVGYAAYALGALLYIFC